MIRLRRVITTTWHWWKSYRKPVADPDRRAVLGRRPYSASGTISPIAVGAGTTIALTGSINAAVSADASGNYIFSGLTNGSYVVTPSKTGYAFSPSSRNLTLNGSSVPGQNFSATAVPPQTYSISGGITNGAGATVVLSGQSSARTTTDSSGNYSFAGLSNGSYNDHPSKSGYTFSPATLTANISGANRSGENFTATANTQGYSISGSLSPSANGAGATLTLGGGSTATVTADGSGNYGFGGLANGTYKVTPSKTGYTFTPATQSVVVNGGNATAINFTAAAGTQTVLFYDDFTSGTLSGDWTILNRPGDAATTNWSATRRTTSSSWEEFCS